MKKVFIAGFFLWLQFTCIASEREDTDLSRTHKLTITDTGRTIYYPNQYDSYEDFKKRLETVYVTELLVERLKMLIAFKRLPKNEREEHTEIYQDIIDNQIALKGNADGNVLDSILFDNSYLKNDNNLNKHALSIANLTKKRIEEGYYAKSYEEQELVLQKIKGFIHESQSERGIELEQKIDCFIRDHSSMDGGALDNADKDIHVSELEYSTDEDIFYRVFNWKPSALNSKQILEKLVSLNRQLQCSLPLQVRNRLQITEEPEIGLAREFLSAIEEYHDFNCYLEMYYMKDYTCKTYYGSGILIAPNLILTAAHNLHDAKERRYPDQIHCFAACDRDKDIAKATVIPKADFSVFIHPTYQSELESKEKDECNKFLKSDIGLIILDKKTSEQFESINWARSYRISKGTLKEIISKKKPLTIIGYSGSRVPCRAEGQLIGYKHQESKIFYDICTKNGQKGSGIYFKNPGDLYCICIGIHAAIPTQKEKYSTGVLIDEVMYNAIRKYYKENSNEEKI